MPTQQSNRETKPLSAHKRPWYPWYPKDFSQDEKVKGLSWNAELIYRRFLDLLWESSDCQIPNNVDFLYNSLAIALAKEEFCLCWAQIQREGFELLVEKNGMLYQKRIKKEFDKTVKMSKMRAKQGKMGGQAKAKQKLSKS